MTRKITTLTVSAKCSDLCNVYAQDADGIVIAEGDGYVPDFMPDEHYGDYDVSQTPEIEMLYALKGGDK